jgi:hypothetical protein
VAVIRWPVEGREAPVGAVWLGECWGLKGHDEDCRGRGATTIHAALTAPLAIWGMGYEGA